MTYIIDGTVQIDSRVLYKEQGLDLPNNPAAFAEHLLSPKPSCLECTASPQQRKEECSFGQCSKKLMAIILAEEAGHQCE